VAKLEEVDTIGRGNANEAAVLKAFVEAGWHVWTPFGDAAPYDLVVGWGDDFLRVQCKSGRVRHGCLIFNAYSTDHGKGRRGYVGRADVFGVSAPELKSVYVIPVGAVPGSKPSLRLKPAANNQKKGIRPAAAYAVERWDPEGLFACVDADPLVLIQ
jgi:hypothetical protein